jgi:hypothetical protein
MTETLELAIAKASKLSDAAQDVIGLELLERIAALEALRAEIQIGLDDIAAGRVREINFEELIAELNREHAAK